VLTPQEVEGLGKVLRRMAEEGKAVIFISHKLREVMSLCHQVTVLRDGKVVGTLATPDTSEKKLAALMVGREVLFDVKKGERPPGPPVLEVQDLEAIGDNGLMTLKGVAFEIREGECVGLAGVSGNGQRELAEVIAGLRKARSGEIRISGQATTNDSPVAIIQAGLAYVPEERKRVGTIAEFSIADNAILETHESRFSHHGVLDRKAINQYADGLIRDYDVKTPNRGNLARTLSGGNLQKLILGRELSRRPKLLIAAQPTRGLDVGATEYIHQQLMAAREQGTGILLISEDLDEVMSLSDRILVLYEGQIVGRLSAAEADAETLGLMMGGAKVELPGS
jgi:simple sugar transport system ATP-binding protein